MNEERNAQNPGGSAAVQDSARGEKFLSRIIAWIEDRPASWIVLGFVITWQATGGLFSGFGTWHLEPPASLAVRGFFFALGAALIILGLAYLISRQEPLRERKLLPWTMIPLALLTTWVTVSYVYGETQNRSAPKVLWSSFDIGTGLYEIQLRGDAITHGRGHQLATALRRIDSRTHLGVGDYEVTPQQSLGEPGDHLLFTKISPELAASLKIGDEVECEVMILKSGTTLPKTASMEELRDLGCTRVFSRQADAKGVSIDALSKEHYRALVERMSLEELQQLQNEIDAKRRTAGR